MKNKNFLNALICLGAAVAMVGCSATRYNRSTGQYIDDKATSARVKAALAKDSLVKASDVHVESFRGNVHLTGFVDHPVQKERASQITRNVRGVEWFKNDIATKEELPSSIERMSSGQQQMNEPSGANRPSSYQNNSANSQRQSFSNSGSANGSGSGWQRGSIVVYDPAADISTRSSSSVGAGASGGSSSSSANISSEASGSSNDLTQRVNTQLRSDNSLAAQNVQVNTSSDGKITLSGTVSSDDEKRRIEDRVKSIEGVNKVENNLEVKSQ
jgi:osmotically-inducible protein OsmY